MAAGSTSSISSRAQFLYVSTSAGSVRSTQSALASRPLELELTEGMRFDKGYISPYLVTDAERMEAVLDEPHVLVVENRISNLDDLLPILEKIMQSGKQLLIIAEEVEGEAAAMMVVRRRLMTRDSRRERAVDSSPLVGGCGTRRDGRPRCPTPTGRGRRGAWCRARPAWSRGCRVARQADMTALDRFGLHRAEVNLSGTDRAVIVQVADEGPGIPATIAARLPPQRRRSDEGCG